MIPTSHKKEGATYHGEVGVEGKQLQIDLLVHTLFRVGVVVLAHEILRHAAMNHDMPYKTL